MPPSTRVQFILGEEGEDDGAHESHPLFSEMEELHYQDGVDAEWNETARSDSFVFLFLFRRRSPLSKSHHCVFFSLC